MNDLAWLRPEWPAPSWVHAGTTMRRGGVSATPYDTLNLGDHVGDDPEAVMANRQRLIETWGLPAMPVWLRQVHGVVAADAACPGKDPEGDASHTDHADVVCAVLTADCLPVLLCDHAGTRVAAVHAGWRGLAAGVVEAAVRTLRVPGHDLMAWLGPAIGPLAFEVGEEVRQAFITVDPAAITAFAPSPQGRWLADIYMLAKQRLRRVGVEQVYGGHWCTYTDAARFYSYRRDGVTGRMASLIWLDSKRP